MKAGFSLPRFIELLLIGCVLLLAAPIASSTAVVNQSKPGAGGCSLLNSQQPSIYLIRDPDWDDPETVRMILRNNSSCSVSLEITGKQIIVRPGGKISQPPLPVAEDGASVVLKYKFNSIEEPWAFITYWPYEHTVSTLTLNGGRSIKFLVQAEHLKQGRQIAVPFNYEWEGFAGASGVEHLVYSFLD
ncbi:MAG TPA: hypothetical protein VFY40_20905 [Blastocatellia bacterium]|nr:hypothetical protein [Blastocatellia bacterium]